MKHLSNKVVKVIKLKVNTLCQSQLNSSVHFYLETLSIVPTFEEIK